MKKQTSHRAKTISQFIIEEQFKHPTARGELSRVLHDIALAGKKVNREVSKAGLVDILGYNGNINAQGEDVMKLDVFAHNEFVNALRFGGACCVIASEENDHVIPVFDEVAQSAKYVVLIDPLDGSSNIDVNVSVGTIFSIYERQSVSGPGREADCLQNGRKQIAAGYILYGSSAMMVYTTGKGVNGFTLDPSIGEFCLSHPNMKFPENASIYSINEGNYQRFNYAIKQFIKFCQEEEPTEGRPYTSRYIGSLVADFHRNLIKGGVFLYPSSMAYPNGKLRLLYECNPISFIAEQAGGMASTGYQPILDIEPKHIHQRVPFIVGAPSLVQKVMSFHAQFPDVMGFSSRHHADGTD